MKRVIKTGDNIGIARQVQGQVVDIRPHPQNERMWQFDFGGETWVASDYAFKEKT